MVESISLHVFFILNCLLELNFYWQSQMSLFINDCNNELPHENSDMVWSGIEWVPVIPFVSSEVIVTNISTEKNGLIYQQSILEDTHNSFFEAIKKDINYIEKEKVDGHPVHEIQPFETYHFNDANCPRYRQEIEEPCNKEYIQMNGWNEVASISSVQQIYSATANAQIGDYLLGEQVWVAEVVGTEQGYLHISDGTARAWINASNSYLFNRGDILLLSVLRLDENEIEVEKIELLQCVSNDFIITDEFYNEGYFEVEEIKYQVTA